MTLEEAKKIAEVLETADGGCMDCAGNLADKMNDLNLEFKWIFWMEKEVDRTKLRKWGIRVEPNQSK